MSWCLKKKLNIKTITNKYNSKQAENKILHI